MSTSPEPRCTWKIDGPPLIVAGMLFGPIYALAWHLARLPNPLDLPKLPNIPGFAWGATEWAEFAAGCAVGAGLLRALLR